MLEMKSEIKGILAEISTENGFIVECGIVACPKCGCVMDCTSQEMDREGDPHKMMIQLMCIDCGVVYSGEISEEE